MLKISTEMLLACVSFVVPLLIVWNVILMPVTQPLLVMFVQLEKLPRLEPVRLHRVLLPSMKMTRELVRIVLTL